MASAKGGISKPLRRSTRSRRQYNPESAYNATEYMKNPAKPAVIEVQATAAAQKARSSTLGGLLGAVLGVLTSMKLKLSAKSWRAVQRKRSKVAAAKRKPKAAKASRKLKASNK